VLLIVCITEKAQPGPHHGLLSAAELRLLQRLDPSDPSGPEKHYTRNHTFSVEIAGEHIDYVFCSQKLLNEYGEGSSLGMKDRDMIFINKNLHPTIVPFVALQMIYQDLSHSEFAEKFGKDTVRGIDEADRDTVIFGAVLQMANTYLRPAEMREFIARQRNEPGYDRETVDSIASEVITAAADANALARRHEESNSFYFERMSAYLEAHGRNKWVKRSKGLQELVSSHESLGSLLTPFLTRCEPAYRDIMYDEKLSEQLPNIVDILTVLEGFEPGTEINLDEHQSYLLYTCFRTFEDKPSKAPFEFTKMDTKNRTNTIRLNQTASSYFASLKKRLAGEVLKEYEVATQALEHMEEFVAKVMSGEQQFVDCALKMLSHYRESEKDAHGTSMVLFTDGLESGMEEFTADLRDTAEDLALVITSPTSEILMTKKALRARRSLKELGIPTPDVDNYLEQLAMGSQQMLEFNGVN